MTLSPGDVTIPHVAGKPAVFRRDNLAGKAIAAGCLIRQPLPDSDWHVKKVPGVLPGLLETWARHRHLNSSGRIQFAPEPVRCHQHYRYIQYTSSGRVWTSHSHEQFLRVPRNQPSSLHAVASHLYRTHQSDQGPFESPSRHNDSHHGSARMRRYRKCGCSVFSTPVAVVVRLRRHSLRNPVCSKGRWAVRCRQRV